MTSHLPVLAIVWPLMAGLISSVLPARERLFKLWGAGNLLACNAISLALASKVLEKGTLTYHLSGIAPPQGLELKVTTYSALLSVLISLVALMAFMGGHATWKEQIGHRLPRYFTLWLLLIASYQGLALSNDAFSIYVMLEVSSLATYGLIAFGGGRAYLATFHYIIMGTIGASFYLVGVGYFYITTGTLNIDDLAAILSGRSDSVTVIVGFAFIVIGLLMKMAVFPLHAWLPNAYTFAPDATSVVVAPLSTKLAVFLLFHLLYDIFNGLIPVAAWSSFMIAVACLGIVAGTSLALAQRDVKKTFACLIVAESGYMLGGLWVADERGTVGALFHLANDMIATLALFLVVIALQLAVGGRKLVEVKGLFQRSPWAGAALIAVALNLIGIPPSAGFFSKYTLMTGAVASGNYEFVVALVFASLGNAVIFFRMLELAFFSPAEPEAEVSEELLRKRRGTGFLAFLSASLLFAFGLVSYQVIEFFILPVLGTEVAW